MKIWKFEHNSSESGISPDIIRISYAASSISTQSVRCGVAYVWRKNTEGFLHPLRDSFIDWTRICIMWCSVASIVRWQMNVFEWIIGIIYNVIAYA